MIDPKFSRGEYWLLETAVTLGIPISPLLLSPSLDQAFNKPGHGMDRRLLQAALTVLTERGLINLYHFRSNSNETQPATVREIASGLSGESRAAHLYYNLSAEGGATWEAFACPKWDRFVDQATSYEDDGTELHVAFASNRTLLQRIFDGLNYVGVFPKPETVRWTEVSPWQATYWKELPVGCRVEFKSAPQESINWDDVPLSYYWISRPRWYSWA